MLAPKTKHDPRRLGARTAKRSRYAKARIAAGLTIRDLRKQGFGMATISDADSGKLPRHFAIRAAYLAAIGLPTSA